MELNIEHSAGPNGSDSNGSAGKVRGPILAIVPTLNEERHIAQVVNGAREFVDEVLVVDDGSTDATVEIARAAGARVLRHSRNRGKAAALQTGFDFALREDFPHVVAAPREDNCSTKSDGAMSARG